MKYLIFLLCFSFATFLSPLLSSAQGKYYIKAKVIGANLTRAEISLYDTTFKNGRQVAITGNRFEITNTISIPFFCKISFPELNAHVDFLLDSGLTLLTIKIDSVQVQGHKIYIAHIINDSISAFQILQLSFAKQLSDISGDSALAQIDKGTIIYNLFKQSLNKDRENIYLAQFYPEIEFFTFKQANDIFNSFTPRMKAVAKKFGASNFLIRAEKTAIGQKYKDFTEMDTLNHPINTDSIKYKFLLIDFAASNCGPCRKQFPDLKILYSKYQSNGFEILGNYLEYDRRNWTKSLVQDQIPWMTVSSLQGFYSMISRYYGLTYIPFNLLINERKEIISKNISTAELERFLKSHVF